MKKPSLCIILPAYNEAPVIVQVLNSLKKYCQTLKQYVIEIVVVNDGSKDQTAKLAQKSQVTVLSHILNRGLGAALATGLSYAKLHNFDIALTMDSDGQHDPRDIEKAIKPIVKNQADVVIGTRYHDLKKVPIDRQFIMHTGSLLTWLFFGVWTTDSQSGFRVFSKKALQIIRLKTQGMEVSSEFFAEIKRHNLKLKEVPIRVIYTKYSRAKGQSNLNSVNVGLKLLLRLFR
ncbi:glycosyltransferase family 2 protein [Candidatus Beckwithbacteria bacterium]|nr:glycosyltransferase family 2 protein [Candidatus Beckwithbacteria bacterium]